MAAKSIISSAPLILSSTAACALAPATACAAVTYWNASFSPGRSCAMAERSALMTVAILAYPPVVWWSASITMGCPLADTCTEPATMPSDTMSDPSTVSICGPCNLQAMRSQSAVKAYTPCTNAACPTAVKASVWGPGTARNSGSFRPPKSATALRGCAPCPAGGLPLWRRSAASAVPPWRVPPQWAAHPQLSVRGHPARPSGILSRWSGCPARAGYPRRQTRPGSRAARCGPRRLPAPAPRGPKAAYRRAPGGHPARRAYRPPPGQNSVPVKLILAALQGHFQHGGTGCLGVARQQVGGPHSVTIRRSTGAEPPRGIAGAACILHGGQRAGAYHMQVHSAAPCSFWMVSNFSGLMGTNRMRSPPRKGSLPPPAGSNRRSGVRPISCHPPGKPAGRCPSACRQCPPPPRGSWCAGSATGGRQCVHPCRPGTGTPAGTPA